MINLQSTDIEITSALVGKTVRYLANKSSVTKDGVRVFKISAVDHVGFGKVSGKRYATVLAKDIDDAGEEKFRNLELAGIEFAV